MIDEKALYAAMDAFDSQYEILPDQLMVGNLRESMTAAITAYLAAKAAEGEVMVPTDDKVTDAMIEAGIEAMRYEDAPAVIFAAMCAARPQNEGE